MLTDALSDGGLEVPRFEGEAAARLLQKLFPGSSVANPIDFLATGTAEQLGFIIDACNYEFEGVDAIAVIFGSPGLFPVDDVYNLLHDKIHTSPKPIFPILPSVINVRREIQDFTAKGNAMFPDEVLFGKALCRVFNTPAPAENKGGNSIIDVSGIRSVIDRAGNGYLAPHEVSLLLKASAISTVPETVVTAAEDAVREASSMGFPVVMKVVGPVHKSDIGGVVLNIRTPEAVRAEFGRLIQLPEVTGILVQKMISGTELFCGAKREQKFGHLVMAGMGGIFIEVFKDVATALVPVSDSEAASMITSLKSYRVIKGLRGGKPISEKAFINVIMSVSALLEVAPEIYEMDINPLLASGDEIVAVDARIRIEKLG
jgi:acetyltransferase